MQNVENAREKKCISPFEPLGPLLFITGAYRDFAAHKNLRAKESKRNG